MKSFKDFNIVTTGPGHMTGEKVAIERVINKPIIVEDFLITPSKKFDGQLLTLQILLDNVQRVIFTGSLHLIQQISQVQREDLPFETVINKINRRFEFT